jgi:hypothetical protein
MNSLEELSAREVLFKLSARAEAIINNQT